MNTIFTISCLVLFVVNTSAQSGVEDQFDFPEPEIAVWSKVDCNCKAGKAVLLNPQHEDHFDTSKIVTSNINAAEKSFTVTSWMYQHAYTPNMPDPFTNFIAGNKCTHGMRTVYAYNKNGQLATRSTYKLIPENSGKAMEKAAEKPRKKYVDSAYYQFLQQYAASGKKGTPKNDDEEMIAFEKGYHVFKRRLLDSLMKCHFPEEAMLSSFETYLYDTRGNVLVRTDSMNGISYNYVYTYDKQGRISYKKLTCFSINKKTSLPTWIAAFRYSYNARGEKQSAKYYFRQNATGELNNGDLVHTSQSHYNARGLEDTVRATGSAAVEITAFSYEDSLVSGMSCYYIKQGKAPKLSSVATFNYEQGQLVEQSEVKYGGELRFVNGKPTNESRQRTTYTYNKERLTKEVVDYETNDSSETPVLVSKRLYSY